MLLLHHFYINDGMRILFFFLQCHRMFATKKQQHVKPWGVCWTCRWLGHLESGHEENTLYITRSSQHLPLADNCYVVFPLFYLAISS